MRMVLLLADKGLRCALFSLPSYDANFYSYLNDINVDYSLLLDWLELELNLAEVVGQKVTSPFTSSLSLYPSPMSLFGGNNSDIIMVMTS